MPGQSSNDCCCWNQDVRQIVAEFAGDDTTLMRMRLLSSEWCAAVAAAAAHMGITSAVRATASPTVMVTATTHAALRALVRAAMALSSGRAVDLGAFPRLLMLDVPGVFKAVADCFGSRNLSLLTVDLSSIQITDFSDVRFVGISGALQIALPSTISIMRSFVLNGATMARLDLSQLTSLKRLPHYFCMKGIVNEMILPATLTSLGEFFCAESSLGRLDLSRSTAVSELPEFFLYDASVEELLLPSTVAHLGESCFRKAKLRVVDLSHMSKVDALPVRFLDNAIVDELLLPPTVTSLGVRCFEALTLPRLDLSHLKLLTSLPRNFMDNVSVADILLPPALA